MQSQRLLLCAVALLPSIFCGCLSGEDPVRQDVNPVLPEAGPRPDAPVPPPRERADAGVDAADDVQDASVGRLELSEARIDFGDVPCGEEPPSPRRLELRNTTASAVAFRAELASGAFEASPASGTVPPGESVAIVITAQAAAVNATAGAREEAVMRLTSDAPGFEAQDVPIARTRVGATLTAAPAEVSFGAVPLTTTGEVPVTIKNEGNRSVRVSFGASTNPLFSVAYAGSPDAVTLEAGATVQGLVARFTPTSVAEAAGTLPIVATGAICGVSASSLAMRGQGARGAIAVEPASIDFGATACGQTAPPRSFTVRNTGNAPATFTLTLDKGASSPYRLSTTTGTLGGGESRTVTVTPVAIPSSSAIDAALYADRVTLRTDVTGDTPKTVTLAQIARGARIVVSRTAVAFGESPLDQPLSSELTVRNEGNAPATITLSTAGAMFSVQPTAARAVSAGSSLPATVRYLPTSVGAHAGTMSLAADAGDVLCAPLPQPVTLSGTGTNGALSVDAQSLDFGSTNCGAQAAARTVTLRNTGTARFGFAAALGRGASSPYTIAPTEGNIDPGQAVVVTITPRPIPSAASVQANAFGDRLTITPSGIVGGSARTVDLTQTARGAILSYSPTSRSFGDVPANTVATTTFDVVNAGNAPATVTLASNNARFAVSPTQVSGIAAGGSQRVEARFEPGLDTSPQSAGVTMNVAGGTPLCAPIPQPLSLSGRGTNGEVAITPTSVDFGLIDCGSNAGGTRTVTLSNRGNAPYTFTAQASATRGTPFSVQPSSGTVPVGGEVALTVTVLPPSSGAGNDAVDGSLRITTSVTGALPRDVPLRMTPRGAILRFSPTSLDFGHVAVGAEELRALTVTNVGNAAVPVSFRTSGEGFGVPGNPTVPAGGAVDFLARFAPGQNRSFRATSDLVAGGAVCGFPGSSLSLTGEGGVVSVSTTFFAYPDQRCGSRESGSASFTIRNESRTPVRFEATLSPSGRARYNFSAQSGELAPGASQSIAIRQLPLSPPVAPGTFDDALTFETRGLTGDPAKVITLRTRILGADLVFQPLTMALGDISLRSNGARRAFTVRNNGNQSIDLAGSVFGWVRRSAPPNGIPESLTVLVPEFWSATVPAGGTMSTSGPEIFLYGRTLGTYTGQLGFNAQSFGNGGLCRSGEMSVSGTMVQ
jgi:hypothetical protein